MDTSEPSSPLIKEKITSPEMYVTLAKLREYQFRM
jgi:hypothetical protein